MSGDIATIKADPITAVIFIALTDDGKCVCYRKEAIGISRARESCDHRMLRQAIPGLSGFDASSGEASKTFNIQMPDTSQDIRGLRHETSEGLLREACKE